MSARNHTLVSEIRALAREALRLGRICLLFLAVYLGTSADVAAARPDVDLQCLALTVYHEARGEPELGMLAVAHVVMNRARDGRFPQWICDVVYQHVTAFPRGCEFTWTCDTLSDRPTNLKAWHHSLRIARWVHSGLSVDPTKGAVWYHADYVTPPWAAGFGSPQQIGRHLFYRDAEVRTAVSIPRRSRAFADDDVRPMAPGSILPDPAQAFLKQLRVTMILYAPDLRNRVAKINNGIYRQGDQLLPGLSLASITPDAIVLRYKNRWFRFAL